MTYNYSDISLMEFPGEVSLMLYSGGCNYYCPYCFNKDLYHKKPLSFKQMKDAIDEHKDFITAVVFTGGEPLMNPYLYQAIKYSKESGLKVKLNTNAFKPNNVRSINYRAWIDYLHISLKDPNYSICKTSSKYAWWLSGDILEYSFVYSPTLMPEPLLFKWVNHLNDMINKRSFGLWDIGEWSRPDIFTISQMQVGNCINSQYNECRVPSREELKFIAPMFKNIPKDKIIIETKEFGREEVDVWDM